MGATFVLPLCPLTDAVLLPGERLDVPALERELAPAVAAADQYGSTVVASLADGDSVHEVGVMAAIDVIATERPRLHGLGRCRLLNLVDEDVPLVRAERFPERRVSTARGQALARLLERRFARFKLRTGRPLPLSAQDERLTRLTWQVTAALELTVDQQQGFLNVPDPLTRGKLLLLVLRELERRDRFLRQWSHLRSEQPWN
jgi:ATP-dependent protease La (LON) substrate-binding domain